MSESIFQTFFLLASFNIALIAVAIANFAVSASYLGRETRLTRSRMERRKLKLTDKLKDLQEKDKQTQISDLEQEIKQAKKDVAELSNRLFLLSWSGAVILPSFCFGVSFIFSVLGMNVGILVSNVEIQNALRTWSIMLSSLSLVLGFLLLLAVINVIDSAARNIPLPKLVASFRNDEETIKVKRNKETTIIIEVGNEGEAIAEDAWMYVNFPPSFKILNIPHGEWTIETMNEKDLYPTYNCVRIILGDIHVDSTDVVRIILRTPDEKKAFEIPVGMRDKTMIDRLDFKLTIEVED
jgi:hypothetical protein